jgi:hypothetical protein
MVMPGGTGKEVSPKNEWKGMWKIAVLFLGFPLVLSLFLGYWPVFLVPLGVVLGLLVGGLVQGLLIAPFVWLLYKFSSGNRNRSHK